MGVRYGELKGLVSDTVSIDEFAAKAGSDQEIIVVGFHCSEELVAHDLQRFISKGRVSAVDSEVSDGPDEDGKWMVFVEFRRVPTFWKRLYQLLGDIKNLTLTDEWKGRAYKDVKDRPLDDPKLRKRIPITIAQYRKRRLPKEVSEHLEDSDLHNLVIERNQITFERDNQQITFDFVDYGPEHLLNERQNMNESINYMLTNPRATALRYMLGEGWGVHIYGDKFLVEKHNHPQYLLLQ